MKFKKLFSDKKLVIRGILFVIVFATAITAFTIGVLSLSKNREGYQSIDPTPDEEALLYASDFSFQYYFRGTSGEIKEMRKALTALYSNTLSRAYKLTDPRNTYTGYENIASLNEKKGQSIPVAEELYNVLKDAYGKTKEKKGYNMFSGPLFEYVYSILILEEPEQFDPLNDPEGAVTRERLAKASDNLDNFQLKFVDDENHIVCFNTREVYENEMEDLETESYPVDLNLLRDAYILEIVGKTLFDYGYTDGYITSKSGLTLTLSARTGLEYCIYGIQKGTTAILETFPAGTGSVFSSFKSFAFGNEKQYYTVVSDGKTVYRNPYISAADGYESRKYLSLYSIYQGDIKENGIYPCSDAVYRNIRIWSDFDEPESAEDAADPGRVYKTCFVLQSDTGTVVHVP